MASDFVGVAGLAQRYAEALFDLAADKNALDDVANEVEQLAAMIDESPDFRRFLSSPILAREDQVNGITAVAKKAGFSDVFTKFLGLVGTNRRLLALPGMIKAFRARMAEHRGEVRARVTASKKLTEKQLSALKASLKKVTGSDVDVDVQVDPSLLGGLVVQVGSRMVDSSIRSKLQRLSMSMKGVA